MKFLIITHVNHKKHDNQYYGYAPYVGEMNIWLKHVDEVAIVASLDDTKPTGIEIAYIHKNLNVKPISIIEFTTLPSSLISLFKMPIIFWSIFKACRNADHIHLRCPGNIGLIGCFVQILFPKKKKTAKYAGNWDPKSSQPFSYKLQKYILQNTLLTKNMTVLVYGNYKNQSSNIKPFFTASYHKSEIEPISYKNYSDNLKFLFIGSIVDGKRPLLSLQIIEKLNQKGVNVSIDFYGDGTLLDNLKKYSQKNNLNDFVSFKGNQPKNIIKEALKKAHFLLLPSKSEGWPKVVAEAMFFGTLPIVTKISCVPHMLDNGKRGILITPDLEEAVITIQKNLEPKHLNDLQERAVAWSHNYTLDVFEEEIKKLI